MILNLGKIYIFTSDMYTSAHMAYSLLEAGKQRFSAIDNQQPKPKQQQQTFFLSITIILLATHKQS